MCSSGNIPAHITAKSVIASAKRLMDVRHFWCSRRRIAEMSVPAWPIPIHQTKLTMAKPQAVGMRMPQIPTPLIISRVIVRFNNINAPNAIRRPKTQPGVTGRVRTIELILSVTVSNV